MQGSSKTRISIALSVIALVFAALGMSACGDSKDTSGGGASAATASEGATGATADQTGSSAENGAADPGSAQGEDGSQGGAGDEEPARAPIDLTVVDGGFSEKTTDEVHVPVGMAIELNTTVEGDQARELTIKREGEKATTHTFPGGKRTSYMVEGLRAGRSMVVSYGSGQVLVIADLVPGP